MVCSKTYVHYCQTMILLMQKTFDTLKFSTSSSKNKRKREDFVSVEDILSNAAKYKSG